VVSPLKVCPQCGTEYPANARFCEIDGTALRSASGDTDLVGSIVADRYHILKKLGEGGMGQVYLAEHVKMGRKSALKVMHASMVKDVDAISRFNREAANASRISHPNVAAVYDFGETPEGMIFLAMEFVDGPPLTKVIEQAGSLAPKRAAEIIRQTSEALAVAHDMGIVHRDLKPDNIMVAKTRDGGDLVKVVDFGIAKAAGSDAQKVTKTGLVVGTPEYMSPEQLAGDKLDGRSDIYALGLVAFNTLTGVLPFPSDSAQESMIMRLTDRPKALGEMRPDVSWPADVQRVMDKALERDVVERYQTATEFGRDLYRAIDRMPETAAAELGTQMIQLPPTRVGPPDEPAPPPLATPRTSVNPGRPPAMSGAAGTLSVPTPQPAAPVVTHTAAPPKRTGMIVTVGGIAAVIVAAAVVVPKVMNGGSKQTPTNPAASITNPATDTTSKGQSGAGVIPPTNVSQQQAGAPAGGDARSSTGSNGANGSTPTGGAPTIDQELTTAQNEASGDSKPAARALLERMDRLEPRLRAGTDSIRVALVRYDAYLTLGDEGQACAALSKMKDRAAGTSLKTKVDNKLEGASCK
jgi:serine/threonine-protein kinase